MDVQVFVNHIGFLCNAKKQVIVKNEKPVSKFQVQDMGKVSSESFDNDENWESVFEGELIKSTKSDGEFYIGDFSGIKTPGVYSVLIPEIKKRSFHFIISDGVFHELPWRFVDFLRTWNGKQETSLKTASTTDDGIRSDSGLYHPVKSGWYDAGDLRKWMTHTNLPALGFYDLFEKLRFHRNYFHEDNLFDNDLLTVSDEAVTLILEMQDPETGKIFECLGAGGFGRADENMSWWYENHSGCLADNSDNRFTDNKMISGDERIIRTDYNALIQYTSITILLRAAKIYSTRKKGKANQLIKAVKRIWDYSISQSLSDQLEIRTAVKSWKLMATIELFKTGLIEKAYMEECLVSLLRNFQSDLSFWCQDENPDDPYRGILHSAQPVISLIQYLQLEKTFKRNEVEELLNKVWLNYIKPLCDKTTYGNMPYGTYLKPVTEQDKFRTFNNKLLYRHFMPNRSKQKINHGLNGHYTSWAHALALMGNYFENNDMINCAWNQIYFTLGFNYFGISFISGAGYNNPMPHSRFLGTQPGGFMAGFIGNTDDTPHVDLNAKAQWNTTEYWNTPMANFCMAIAELLPKKIPCESKLGVSHN